MEIALNLQRRLRRCSSTKGSGRIAVITPYKAQKDQVIKLMLEKGIELESRSNPEMFVRTINECQGEGIISVIQCTITDRLATSGDEFDYVILTTVRSLPLKEIQDHRLVQAEKQWLRENLGFVTDEHQVNVAITRAKQGLIIVGELAC